MDDGCGTVFTLVPSTKGFTEHVLYVFQGSRENDGGRPFGGVLIDRQRNLLGTTLWAAVRGRARSSASVVRHRPQSERLRSWPP